MVEEVSLIRVARQRSGDAGFRVGLDRCVYHAELGLATGDGGWLMLARSNRLDKAAGIGLRLPVAQERPPAIEPSARFGLVPQFPLVGPTRSQPTVEPAGTTPRHGDLRALEVEVEGLCISSESADRGLPGDTPLKPSHQFSHTPLNGRPLCLDRQSVPPAAEALAARVSIDPLVYGATPTRTSGLRMEAELRILGAAAPGSLIDLFGHPFRVGPGGRFQLTLRVDDPDLLRRALELHPPPELSGERDDL